MPPEARTDVVERAKALLPTAVAIAVLAALWIEVSLNFTFQWFTHGPLGNGLELPKNFHLVVTAAFVPWAFYYAAGADAAATRKVGIGTVAGAVCGLVVMWLAPAIAGLPDFYGITIVVTVLAFGGVVLMAAGDWWYFPSVFGAFAIVITWWVATGLDNWAEGGGGGDGLAALADPATAGAGAFGGVLSTPYGWVFASTLVSMLIGVGLGVLSSTAAKAMTPRRR